MNLKPGRLMRTLSVAALAGSLFALSACGSDDAPDVTDDAAAVGDTEEAEAAAPSGEFRNGPIPDADPSDNWGEDELPAEPDRDAPFSEGIEHQVLVWTAEFAHDYDPDASVTCDDTDGSTDETITCTATFFGTELPWQIAISGGSMVASFSPESSERIVSRGFVEDALRYEKDTEDVYCDFEEYVVVDSEADESFECRSLADGEESVWELSLSGYGEAYFYSA